MSTEYTEEHRAVSKRVGEEFVVALEEHPTGHEWEAKFDPSVLALVGNAFSAAGPGLGAGGTRRFRFRTVAPGETELRMSYRRRWETAPARVALFQVQVAA